jgi:hypothetical protein
MESDDYMNEEQKMNFDEINNQDDAERATMNHGSTLKIPLSKFKMMN